ncbi:hypothetical protein TNCV_4792811 [Trichonephila clavipes]|nr:hypothetical protein TNCV_4792811 [Trichonephila clavipes]
MPADNCCHGIGDGALVAHNGRCVGDNYTVSTQWLYRIALPEAGITDCLKNEAYVSRSEVQIPAWARSTQPFSGSVNEYQACLEIKHWRIRVRLPDLDICSCTSVPKGIQTEIDTVRLGPYKLLRHKV